MTDELRILWDRVKHTLEPALARDGHLFTLDDVWQAVQNGQAQFWPAPASAVITEIKVYPRGKVLHVWLAGGRLDEIADLTGYIKRFGKERGCRRISLVGRRGWARVLGLTPTSVTLNESL